jgi:signal transduction histidine kinase
LSRSLFTRRRIWRLPWLLAAALLITLAVGLGLLLAEVLMAPPIDEMSTLALYFLLSGSATLSGGWLVLRLADRTSRIGIGAKAFLASAIGGAVGLLNVLIIARLMFVSTTHDLQLLAAVVAFSAFVSIFFSLRVAFLVAARVSQVLAMIRSLAAGDYRARVVVDGGDEIARLARDVNQLAERLRQAEEDRNSLDATKRELTAAISHDLRTPLASIRAMAEALDDAILDDPEERARYYRAIRREVERLDFMINDLFELAQIDAGAIKLDLRPLSVQEIAAEVVDAMQPQARQRSMELRLNVLGRPPVALIDGSRIERAIANLLRNALEHSEKGGRIEVDVFDEGLWVGVSVSDSGDGITDADLPRVWDRFYRAEKSRRRTAHTAEGAGLGLAIVRGLVEAHGGETAVQSRQGLGSRFVIRLPAAS